MAQLRKLLEEALDTNVLVDLSASKVRFTLGGENGVVLTSKLIDGTFPDYSRVIPTGNDKLLRLDPKSFWQGVDRVATIATEKTRAVKMALENDKVTLSVTSPTTARRRKRWRLFLAALRDRLQRELPEGHPRSDRGRYGGTPPRRCRRADPDPPGRQEPRALRPDADAGVSAPYGWKRPDAERRMSPVQTVKGRTCASCTLCCKILATSRS